MPFYNKNVSTKEDYQFGFKNEKQLKNKIEEILKCSLEETSRYNSFDFINTLLKIFVELKSRRISKEQYSTTFINYQKIEKINQLGLRKGLDSNNNYYFFFNYTNGLYYIKYDKQLFDTFQKKDTFLQKRRCMLKNLLIPTDTLIKC